MDNYLDELKQAGILLQNGKYIDCSIKCGKIIELLLKALLRQYADERKFHVPPPYNRKSIDRLSLGDIFYLIENDNFVTILAQEFKLSKNVIRSYFNKIVVTIRNDATHTLDDDGKVEAKAGAFVIFGHLLFFQKIFSKIKQTEKVVVIKNIIKPGDTSATQPYRGLEEPKEIRNVYQNKSSEVKVVRVPSASSGTIITPDQIFEYRIHGAVARMVWRRHGTYTLLKGSTAVRVEKGSIPENAKIIRRDLIRSGKLTADPNRDVYKFQDDVDFQSPSSASCVISASSTNGLICFKDQKSGKTLKEVFP